MVANASFHSRGNAQGLMDTPEVVIHEVERHSIAQVFNLFAESVSKASKPAHSHPHGQVLALYEASANVSRVGVTANCPGDRAAAVTGAVAP